MHNVKIGVVYLKKNALVIATIGAFIRSFELNNISILQQMGYTVHVATNMHYSQYAFLDFERIFKERNIIAHHIDFERSPFSKSNFKAKKQIQNIIAENEISLVHCHTPVGGVIGRLAAKKFRKSGLKLIYTVHGLQFYNGAPKKDWMLFYPVEKLLSRYADAMITINLEDYETVKAKMKAKKIYYVPGIGVDYDKFSGASVNRAEKRAELGIKDDQIFLLSVGELNDNKNHCIVINALSKLNNKKIKYIIAGVGPIKETLQSLISALGLQKQVFLVGQRPDIPELLKCADIFVFPSIREGLSVSLMEAMAGGVPVICSKIRGNVDLIDDGKGGILCEVNSADDYANGIKTLIDNEQLRVEYARYSDNKIKNFSLTVVDKKMREIYSSVSEG